jgi:uncharacterized membrane protein
MLRTLLMPRPSSSRSEPWTLRGINAGRIESFSDATFSFTLALLIFATEVPKDFDQLLAVMPGFFSFAACFVILTSFWRRHVLYFLRYGLSDTATVWLNTALLAVVLFYIYPLKFLMDRMTEVFFFAVARGLGFKPVRPGLMAHSGTLPGVMAIYLVGFAGVALAFALMFHHALRRRVELRLSPYEEAATLDDLVLWLIATIGAMVAAAGCWWLAPDLAPLSSMALFSIPIVRRMQRRRRQAIR